MILGIPRLPRISRILNVLGQAVRARMTSRRIPLKIILQITSRCNLRCSYCYVPFRDYQDRKDMTTRQVLDLIDLFHAKGTRWLWIVGGEPLLRPDLDLIVSHAQKKGIFTDLTTNGLLIRESHIPLLKKLDSLCVSVDSSIEAHDAYRGEGSYEKLGEIIAMLVRNGIRPRLHSMLTKKTAGHLEELEKFASSRGVLYNYCEILKEGGHPDDLSAAEHEEFYKDYLRIGGFRSASANSRYAMEKLLAWPKAGVTLSPQEAESVDPSRYVSCRCGDLQCFVDVDGSLYSCSARWKKGRNIFRDGFDAAWEFLSRRECAACRCLGMAEASLLLQASPAWYLQALKNLLRI